MQPGVNFINVLRTAFTPVVPQSVSTQSNCQYLFMVLGSMRVKAVRRTLMKLSPVSPTNCAQLYKSKLEVLFLVNINPAKTHRFFYINVGGKNIKALIKFCNC